MSERTFTIANFTTRPAPKSFYFEQVMLNRAVTKIWIHTERWYGITPNTNNRFFKCSSNMHQTSIMCYNHFCSSYQVGTFIERKFAAGVVDLDRVDRSDPIADFPVFKAAKQ